ncbi:hypothetical protein ATE84_0820 [Aquimarina sp. MAR_2010_214]|uniref:hypothetical protein n=1 Tax=Aquimarina sp. MAR_2010_214 TaxID=1250026 RepID=UPI000C6FDCC5|nr:hypothetical protein [Aquimarina sp. MAR_2010_214]PKV48806.1 hypothetical protein ATE84_0820 [Aquimarina sp. MAR_2010_214]
MKPQKIKLYLSIFCISAFLFMSCSKEDKAIYLQGTETELDYEYYKVDLSKPYTDLSNDERFKNLTPEQILTILEYYSPGTTNPSKQNEHCKNCVAHVMIKGNLNGVTLMPTWIMCDNEKIYTSTVCLDGKMALINSNRPVKYSAVIMDVNNDSDTFNEPGHVGFVKKVVYYTSNRYMIKVNHGNWPSDKCSEGWIDGSDSRIKGYQNPYENLCNNLPFHYCPQDS